MKRRLITVAAALLFCVLTASLADASGYAVYEFSARGNALGGALVARADDPSALAFNPAGITQLEGTHIAAGGSFFVPRLDFFANGESAEAEDRLWSIPHFYLTHALNDRVSFGIAEYSRFGLGTDIDEDWSGNANIYRALIQSFSINPNVAVKLTDELSVALGVEYTRVAVELRNKIMDTYDTKLEADGDGWGVTAGLHYKPNDEWRFGVSWKSQVEVDDEGTQEWGGFPLYEDGDVHGTIIVPDMIFFGTAWYPTDKLSVEVGAVLTRWSLYDNLNFHYENAPKLISAKKEWHDAWRFNVGLEYALTEQLTGRLGYIYDQSPINEDYTDFLVPGNDRQLYSAGLGYAWNNWTFDASYTFVWVKGRDYGRNKVATVPDDAHVENGHTHIYGVTVGYQF